MSGTSAALMQRNLTWDILVSRMQENYLPACRKPCGNMGCCAIVQGYRLPRQMDINVTLRIHSLGKMVRSLLLCDNVKSG